MEEFKLNQGNPFIQYFTFPNRGGDEPFDKVGTSGAMVPNRIYCAEQIEVHPDLHGILKEYTKAAIRANPEDLDLWSLNYFKKKTEEMRTVKR